VRQTFPGMRLDVLLRYGLLTPCGLDGLAFGAEEGHQLTRRPRDLLAAGAEMPAATSDGRCGAGG
jgi:hypothetical protein